MAKQSVHTNGDTCIPKSILSASDAFAEPCGRRQIGSQLTGRRWLACFPRFAARRWRRVREATLSWSQFHQRSGLLMLWRFHVNKRRAPLMQASLRSSRSQLNSSDFNLKEENGAMKQTIRFAVAAVCLSFMSIATAIAQDQYTEGGVTRVTLVQILPGRFNAFMDDLKTNLKPIWDAEKKAGLIENYNIFLNTTKANPDDWDIGFALSYKNFAALDGLAQKVLDLRMKQYGDKSKEQQVIDKRVQNARVVTSVLTREITLK